MAEALDQEVQDSTDDIARASAIGWTPKGKFRGDPERFVTAKDYLHRADTVMPLLKRQRDELLLEVQSLKQQDAARDGEIKAIRAALKAVEDTQEEDLTERVAAAKDELQGQIAQASKDEDYTRVAKLTGDLAELIAAEKIKASRPAPKDKEDPAEIKTPPLTPEYQAWASQNTDWLGSDQEKTDMAIAFGQAIARTGLRGKLFYAELDKRLDKYYGDGSPNKGAQDSKVGEGSRPANGGNGEDTSANYADLPKDAKETCDRLERKMVGEGKPHKDRKSWRASYVRQYNELEAR